MKKDSRLVSFQTNKQDRTDLSFVAQTLQVGKSEVIRQAIKTLAAELRKADHSIQKENRK